MNHRRLATLCALAAGLCLQPACASSSTDDQPDERPALTEVPAEAEPGEQNAAEQGHEGHAHEADAGGGSDYTCAMHPSVTSDSPGTCSVCGMDLVEKKKDAADEKEPIVHAVERVAVVDGADITAEDFNEDVKRQRQSMGGQIPARVAEMIKVRTLDRLIEQRLIERALDKHADRISVEEAEIDEAFDTFKERLPNEDAWEAFLERNGLTAAQMRKNQRKDLALRKLLGQIYDIDVSSQDARNYYDEHIQRYEQEEQVRARHILIKLGKDAGYDEVEKARLQAAELSERARQSDVDFAELARNHSQGPSASRGGDLGFFTEKRMVPAFSKAAFSMSPGDISGPIRTQFGFHVISVEDHKQAGTTPFSEAEDDISTQLERQQLRDAMKQFLADLEANAKIERFEEHIEVNAAEANPSNQGEMPLQLKKPTVE